LDRLATLVSALADPDLVRAIEQLVVLPEPTRRTLISHGGKRLVDLLALTERLALERRGAKVFEAQLLAELHELGSQHASFLRLKASLEAQLVVLQGTIAALNKSQRRTQDRTATRP
jgi:hypothetical protein